VRQLLQEVGTQAASPRTTFAKNLAEMETAAEEEVRAAVTMTGNKRVEYLVRPSDAVTRASTWNTAYMDRIVSQVEREIQVITSNE